MERSMEGERYRDIVRLRGIWRGGDREDIYE